MINKAEETGEILEAKRSMFSYVRENSYSYVVQFIHTIASANNVHKTDPTVIVNIDKFTIPFSSV